ncbi:unnamed protein product [Orchesella dallaii]|uniref:G-protein coupled receptors family 2 profile 2 domain-containing protein n=1 Tax=Orchesella dallaii TaxID=48710 RepID=A0ABP1QG07_9HEXA
MENFIINNTKTAFCSIPLLACPDFDDLRMNPVPNQSHVVKGLDNNFSSFVIIRPDYFVLENCSETVLRYVNFADETNQLFSSEIPSNTTPLAYSSRISEKFEINGDYYDGYHYFQRSEYCVKSVSETSLLLKLCQLICNSHDSASKNRFCIPKCCPPNEILGYWSDTCRPLQQHEPAWKPVVCENEKCMSIEPLERAHFHRHRVSCGRNTFRQAISEVELSVQGHYVVDPKANIRMDVTSGSIVLQRLSGSRVWLPYDINFCVDGFINMPWDNYTGASHMQVFVVCFKDEYAAFVPYPSSNTTATIVAHVAGSVFLLLIFIVYLVLVKRQNFNGLVILSYSLSLVFSYGLFTAAHYISTLPNPEDVGLFYRGWPCMSIAIGAHYTLFVTFSWLTVMNFNLWQGVKSLQSVNSTSKRLKAFTYYSILVWGLPALLVSAFVAIDEIYRDPASLVVVPDYAVQNCYVASWSRGYYVFTPIAIFLFVNGILVLLTYRILLAGRTNASKMIKTGADKYTPKLFLKLFFVMGMTSVLQLLSWYFDEKSNPWYIEVSNLVMSQEPLIMGSSQTLMENLEEANSQLSGGLPPSGQVAPGFWTCFNCVFNAKWKQHNRIEKELMETVTQNSKYIEQLNQENEELPSRIFKTKLVVSGLHDFENEAPGRLKSKICILLQNWTGKQIIPDTVFRIGSIKENFKRPIKIRFAYHTNWNEVLQKRENLPKEISIKPDLPFSIRSDYGILRRKKDELDEIGIGCDINRRNKTLLTSERNAIQVKEVQVFPQLPPINMDQGNFLKKRKMHHAPNRNRKDYRLNGEENYGGSSIHL